MVTRGSGATKAKYFEFGGSATKGSVAEYGACMPQKTLDTIMRNGCFDASFKDNLRKVWRPMPEIKKSLEARRDALKLLTESVQAAYAATDAAACLRVLDAMEADWGEEEAAPPLDARL